MNVPIRTSSTSALPCGVSCSQIAWTIARPIQSRPNRVAAMAHETFSRRGRNTANRNTTGKTATSALPAVAGPPEEARADQPRQSEEARDGRRAYPLGQGVELAQRDH